MSVEGDRAGTDSSSSSRIGKQAKRARSRTATAISRITDGSAPGNLRRPEAKSKTTISWCPASAYAAAAQELYRRYHSLINHEVIGTQHGKHFGECKKSRQD